MFVVANTFESQCIASSVPGKVEEEGEVYGHGVPAKINFFYALPNCNGKRPLQVLMILYGNVQ